MNTAHFDPDARAEFLAAIEYYEECQVGLGRRFRLAVETELEHVCQMPFRFRVLRAPYRCCMILKFPYHIVFRIEPKFILVMAVAHAKRKPGYWHGRMK